MNGKHAESQTRVLLDLIAWTRRVLAALREDRLDDEHVAGVLKAVIAGLDLMTNPRLAGALKEERQS